MGTVIAIANQKGGVGKTLTTTCLASAFTKKKLKVLTISLDPQRNFDMVAGKGIGIQRNDTQSLSILHALHGTHTLDDVIVHTELLGDLARASSQLYQFTGEQTISTDEFEALRDSHDALVQVLESRLKSGATNIKVLDSLIKTVKDRYDYILIDTNPSLTLLTLNSIYAADYIIIPAFSERQSSEAIVELYDTVRSITYFNPDTNVKILGILMTRCNVRTLAFARHAKMFNALAEKMGTRLFNTKIRASARASDYVDVGMDLINYDPHGKTTEDYLNFSEELLQVLKEEEVPNVTSKAQRH